MGFARNTDQDTNNGLGSATLNKTLQMNWATQY